MGVPSESSTLYTSPMQPPPIGRMLRRCSPREVTPSATISSRGTAVPQVSPPDILQESLRSLLNEVHDQLEAPRSAIVGVRALRLRPSRYIFDKEPHLDWRI